ncbi:uncharacterized protein LOC119681917 [Teleopsis dalmanni]|uniref:uncharacterized protein LOC119681917 n=1 Tax=Teleopsis dalmanni TaxID=139649 RepID=UPI0018CEFBA8|nr:uncharacterized protein LOC119681917 [Teleopsis dalmanni]
MDSMNNVHNEGGSYSFSAQNVSPCVKNSNKKWSISRLFLKKKEINSDSSSQEDEAGFKSIQKNNRTKNSKQKSNIKKTYDNRKCNELRLFQNSDISIMSLNSGKVIDQNNSKEPEYELFLPFETSPIDVNAAHLHKPLNHPDLRNSTTSLPPLFNKPLTNFSSNASQRQSSDGNTNIGALVVNVSNRRTRSARNERYYKRLSRDFENSTKKDERLFYTSVTKPKKSKEFFDNINFLPVDNTRQSGLNGNFDSQFENTYGLQNISPYVSYSKQTQGTNQLLNPIDTKRSISCDSQICSNVINKCLSLTPPTPPPRGTSRQIHVSKSMQILNNTRSRPQSYAFDENSRLCSSDIKEYKNTLIKSGKKYQSRSAHLLNTIPINSVAKNLEPVETVSKSRRFITRGNRSPLNRKSSPTVKMATDYTYDTLPVIDGTCTLSHNTVPNTSSIYYIADALPRSRKPIHVNNMMTINNDNLNKQIAQLVEVSNISNIAEKIVDQHNNTSENYNEKKNLFPNSCNCFKIKNNTVENTKLSLISGKQCECGNVTHIEQDKHSKPYKNHKNLVNLMTSNIQNSNDVYNENLYDRYVAERREKHKMPIYETYMRPHNNVKVYNKLQQSQLESSSNLEDAINELETIYKSLDFQETSKTSDNESFFNLKNNNFCQYDSYDEESPSGEPDPVLDDVAYRNMKIVNSKTVEVLPFGIPLKPIVQASKTDYLNIHSITNMKKREITNLPDIVKDDLAVRTLRKDNPLTNQMCIPPKCEQKGNRVIRTQSANNFALIKRDAAKPSGGDVKFYTEVTPAIKRSESAENMYKLNVTKEDCDLLHTLCNMKHKDCLLSATANVTVTAKHIQIPFHHPSQKGAISELPNKLFSSSDNPNKTMIAKDKTLSPQFPGTNNGNENLENSTTLSKKFKKLCNDNDTCFHNTHEKSLINSKEEIENVSSKTISNNLTPTPSEIVSKNIINLLKTDKECEDRKYDKTFLVEMSKPTTKCDLAVPNLLKNLDPIKSDKIEEISKRCMIDLIKLGNDVEVVGKNNVIIEPDIVRMNSISIFEKCQQNISPNKQIVEKDSQHICHSKNNNENALNSSVGASSMSSSSDCLVKSSSLSINLHQSSSITSFNPYSSSDYIKSSSSENPTLSTDAIKTFSTTSYDAKSSSTTPNITTNSNISHSPTPPLRFCEDKNLSNLSEVSNEGLLLSPEYNSTEELTTIFGIGQYLIRDVKSENSKLNENESGNIECIEHNTSIISVLLVTNHLLLENSLVIKCFNHCIYCYFLSDQHETYLKIGHVSHICTCNANNVIAIAFPINTYKFFYTMYLKYLQYGLMEPEMLIEALIKIYESNTEILHNRPISATTLHKHCTLLIQSLESIRVLLNVHFDRFTTAHKAEARKIFGDLREKAIKVTLKKGINVEIPTTLNEKISINIELNIDTDSENTTEHKNIEMAQAQVELDRAYIKETAIAVPEFDGKKQHLERFIRALRLIDRTKGTQEDLAVEVIKSKITGPILYRVKDEETIQGIITKLSLCVKGESIDVIKAKLMNIQQRGKTATQYTAEINNLCQALEGAYIDNGVDADNAETFSRKEAISSMTKNCTNDRLKTIMEAGTFNSLNEAVSKYVNCCTEMHGRPDAILYYSRINNRNTYRGNYNRRRGRGNNSNQRNSHRNNNQDIQSYGNEYQNNRNPRRGSTFNTSRGQGRNNIRVIQQNSEN